MKAESLDCPNCSASLSYLQIKAKVITCQSCGSVVETGSGALLASLKNSKYKPESYIRLGMRCQFKGTAYQVVGRICYQSELKEYCNEDRRYYPEGTWAYDSWCLLSENGEYAWITEDEEGFQFSKSFVPDVPLVPTISKPKAGFLNSHRPQKIKEFSTSKIVHFEGEFTWQPNLGDLSKSASYTYRGESFEVNSNLDRDGQTKEIEFFRGRKVPELQLALAFDNQQEIERLQEEKRSEELIRRSSIVALAGAVFLFALSIYFLAFDFGSRVANYYVKVSELTGEGKTVGPVNLKKSGRLHRLVLRGSIPNNRSFQGGVELMDSTRLVINNVDGDFWRESGWDSDGRWSESDLKASQTFRLSKAGHYFFRFYSSKPPASLTNLSNSKLQLSVYEGVIPARFFFLSSLFLLLYAFTIRRFKTTNPLFVALGMFSALVAFCWLVLKVGQDDD